MVLMPRLSFCLASFTCLDWLDCFEFRISNFVLLFTSFRLYFAHRLGTTFMKLLDRYILRLFLLNFIILLAVVMAMIVTVDMMFNLDEFMDAGRRIAEIEGGSSLLASIRVMIDFYIPQVCFIYVYLAGLIVIAAMGFTFTALSRTGELVTLIASGISLYRAAAPVLV